jgi:hypothetical protein
MHQATERSEYRTGQWVVGVYFGKPFSGRISPETRPTPDYYNIQFHIVLDAPIEVFGQVREQIYVETNSSNTLYLE